jgi:ribosomal protein S18 acetylase RimI-like enzyme
MTDLDTIEIRPAGPDNEVQAARLLYSTARPVFEFLYGPDRDFMFSMLAWQWQAEESLFSHRHTLGAYTPAGDLIGLELGMDNKGDAGALAGSFAVSQARASTAQRAHISQAAPQLTYFTPFTPDGSYCVHNLAVDPDAGVRGLGRRLLQGAFDREGAAGRSAVCLDVLDDNPAVSFYLHMGMELACEVRLPRLIEDHGMPAIFRMVKECS